ncbi:MAG: outer membrane protein assembly factor BamD, partial [Oligoflexia bacterium]|nr:outer membrane protein assembly factor BamD [Oligoflexia bacterium]
KVSALETKLDVLTATLEKMQMKKAQPIIEADLSPQKSMSAPVFDPTETAETEAILQNQVTEEKENTASQTENTTYESLSYEESETEFKAAMTLFQNGRNIEASSRFALVAKKFPRHQLAPHALYWAGEASAREKQWSTAILNWEQLERLYPTSTYVADAMAGLSRAYEMQGDSSRSASYKNTVLQSFPNSPVALNFHSKGTQTSTSSAAPVREEIPKYHQGKDSPSEHEDPSDEDYSAMENE